MSINTTVHTKQEFLKMLSDSISDDQVILWTQNVNTIEVKKRAEVKQITFGFAANGFEQTDGVNDLMRLKGMMLGVVVCSRDILSKGALELVPVK